MSDTTVRIALHPKQSQAFDLLTKTPVRRLGYGGARGGGKSYLVRAYQFYRRLTIPKSRGLILRKTLPELQRNHVDMIKREYPDLLYKYREQKHRFEFANGSFLDLMYLQYETDLDKLQGAEYEDIALDEAQQHGAIVPVKLRACLRTSIPGVVPKMIFTFNPGGIGHVHLKQAFIDPKELPEDMAFVQATVDDNPSVNKEYVEELDALPEQLRKAWRFGDWTVFEGMFFPEFGEHLRVAPYDIPPHECNLYGSLDYGDGQGERSGATSFNLWHVGKDGRPVLLMTYYKKHQTAATYAREVVAAIQSFHHTQGTMPKAVFADPSMFTKRRMDDTYSKSPADIFHEHGLTLTAANNDRINGWRVMRDFFALDTSGLPKMTYFDGYNIEFEEYVPTMIHHKINPNDLLKGGEDHVADSCRYGLVALMGMRSAAVAKAKSKSVGDINYELMKMSRAGQISITGLM